MYHIVMCDDEKELSEIRSAYAKQQDMAKEIKNIQEQSRLLTDLW